MIIEKEEEESGSFSIPAVSNYLSQFCEKQRQQYKEEPEAESCIINMVEQDQLV
jgi:hypothetical protein